MKIKSTICTYQVGRMIKETGFDEDRIDLEDARKTLAEAEEEGTVSWEEFKLKLKLLLKNA